MKKTNASLTGRLRVIAYAFLASLFFMGNIKFFKMVFSYIGLESYATWLATGLFALFAAAVLVYFALVWLEKRDWKCGLVLVALCLAYSLPYLLNAMAYRLVQYCLFMVPFGIAAYLLCTEDGGIDRFLEWLYRFSKYAVWLFCAYILLLCVGDTSEFGIVIIKEMSYGDISLAALPLLYVSLWRYTKATGKEAPFIGLRILVYLAAVIYSGTRSSMLCMAVAFLVQIILNFKQLRTMKPLRIAASALAIVLVVLFCTNVVPAGSRLNVVKGNMLHEMNNQGGDKIFATDAPSSTHPNTTGQSEPPAADPSTGDPGHNTPDDGSTAEPPLTVNTIAVYSVAQQKYVEIDQAFEYYIVNSDCTISQTQEMLKQDIDSGAGNYIIVAEENRDYASEYRIPITNRVYLWGLAWREFMNAPITGNGMYHYEQKYEGTFPHNIVLEALCDFGLVGGAVLVIAAVVLFLWSAWIAWKKRCAKLGQVLGLIVMYIPMHLLFHALYFNGILFFTFALMIFTILNRKNIREDSQS